MRSEGGANQMCTGSEETKRDDKMTTETRLGSRFDRNYGSACRGLLRSSGFKGKTEFSYYRYKASSGYFIRNLAQIKKQQLSLIIMQGFFRRIRQTPLSEPVMK